jgi:ATP/maltotriose-dependent transcriptional regulator MalT
VSLGSQYDMTTPEGGPATPVVRSGGQVRLEDGRAAYRRRDWVAARERLLAAREQVDLGAEDLYALGDCFWWLGAHGEGLPILQEAYRAAEAEEHPELAARIALDVAYTLSIRGEGAPASGWMRRAYRIAEELPEERPLHGYLAYVEFEQALDGHDLEGASTRADRVSELGGRCEDRTLLALGALGRGRVLVRRGQVRNGMPLLDEAMLAAVSDELPPDWAGNIYCHLMVACEEIADLRRAAEWTQVTARWCEAMPAGAGPFMGICRVHRAHVLQLRGDWDAAEREARHVVEDLIDFDLEPVANAQYVLGELARQRGDLAAAEAAFRDAHRLGRDPQPGLALLRMATGETEMALTSLRSALSAVGDDPLARARLLPGLVEVAVRAGAVDEARAGAEELAGVAAACETTGAQAVAQHALGKVSLADGDAVGALTALRDALRCWQGLGAAYETARIRDELARAYELLGDAEAAARERHAAAGTRDELGVGEPGRTQRQRSRLPADLTAREAEILQLVARGRSNQAIADHLVLSVRTVERHLATVYQKLGVGGRSARAAAVSFAHREGLVEPPDGRPA